jgi:serine/threonine-protein kinase TTK/MPS1
LLYFVLLVSDWYCFLWKGWTCFAAPVHDMKSLCRRYQFPAVSVCGSNLIPASEETPDGHQEDITEDETARISSTAEIAKLMKDVKSASAAVHLRVDANPSISRVFDVKTSSVRSSPLSTTLCPRNKSPDDRRFGYADNGKEDSLSSSSEEYDTNTIKVSTVEVKALASHIMKTKRKPTDIKIYTFDVSETSAKKKQKQAVIQDFSEPNKIIRSSSLSSSASSSSSSLTTNIFQQKDKYLSLNGKSYFQLSLVGKGGSSSVYKVISTTSGNLYALKKVDISKQSSNDEDDADRVFESYANEIDLLNKLKNSNSLIIDLIDYQICKEEKKIYMLLELGDIDLAKLLSNSFKLNGSTTSCSSSTLCSPSVSSLDPMFIRMVWKEMLLAVHHIHENRIVHGDLKPANFVFVRGHLKLIDFGIAKSFSSDTTNIYRDSQIGTVNYMAPESISPHLSSGSLSSGSDRDFPMKIGRASDIWSLGCILYQMIYSKPPFAHLNTIQKLMAIPNPSVEISYPDHADYYAVETIKCCLQKNPRLRASILGERGLLNNDFLRIPSMSTPRPILPALLPSEVSSIIQTRSRDKENVDVPHKNILISNSFLKSKSLKELPSNVKAVKLLPTGLKEEIIQAESRLISVQSEEAHAKASKWMKGNILEASDMKSVLEKRMFQMR